MAYSNPFLLLDLKYGKEDADIRNYGRKQKQVAKNEGSTGRAYAKGVRVEEREHEGV